MKKTVKSPLILCILPAILLYTQVEQEVHASNGYLQKGSPVIHNLIHYSSAIATVDGKPISELPGGKDAAPELTEEQLGEMLLQAVQSRRGGQIAEIRKLLRMGANPDYKPHKKALSPLDIVVQGGMLTLAKVFQQHGIRFDKRGSRGITYLHQAAAGGKLPMVQFLVSLGVNPNIRTTKDWTPLHHAARFGHPRIVLYLIRAGADSKLRNSDGFTPKELAINARYYPVSKLFY